MIEVPRGRSCEQMLVYYTVMYACGELNAIRQSYLEEYTFSM